MHKSHYCTHIENFSGLQIFNFVVNKIWNLSLETSSTAETVHQVPCSWRKVSECFVKNSHADTRSCFPFCSFHLRLAQFVYAWGPEIRFDTGNWERSHLFETASRLPAGHLHATGVSHALTPFSLIRKRVEVSFDAQEGVWGAFMPSCDPKSATCPFVYGVACWENNLACFSPVLLLLLIGRHDDNNSNSCNSTNSVGSPMMQGLSWKNYKPAYSTDIYVYWIWKSITISGSCSYGWELMGLVCCEGFAHLLRFRLFRMICGCVFIQGKLKKNRTGKNEVCNINVEVIAIAEIYSMYAGPTNPPFFLYPWVESPIHRLLYLINLCLKEMCLCF
jgi:hypothetical protein